MELHSTAADCNCNTLAAEALRLVLGNELAAGIASESAGKRLGLYTGILEHRSGILAGTGRFDKLSVGAARSGLNFGRTAGTNTGVALLPCRQLQWK